MEVGKLKALIAKKKAVSAVWGVTGGVIGAVSEVVDAAKSDSTTVGSSTKAPEMQVRAPKRPLTDDEMLEQLRKRQRRVEQPLEAGPSELTAKPPQPAEPVIGNLSESESTVLTWMTGSLEKIGNVMSVDRKLETLRGCEVLRRSMEQGEFPMAVSAGLAKAASLAQVRRYKAAHEAYLEVAVGKAAWPIGIKGLQVKVRGCNDLIQPVHHVLDTEEKREMLTTFKRLLSAVQAANPSEDPAENVNL